MSSNRVSKFRLGLRLGLVSGLGLGFSVFTVKLRVLKSISRIEVTLIFINSQSANRKQAGPEYD